MKSENDPDIVVIGGGLVGSALAYGLARRRARVLLLDEGDIDLRASRVNFGLVWIQTKGENMPQYTSWSRRSAMLWPKLAEDLKDTSGIDVAHRQPGGCLVALSELELARYAKVLAKMHEQSLDGGFDYEILDNADLGKRLPGLGPTIPGGSYSPYDGHVNPLKTLRAVHGGYLRMGGRYRPNSRVLDIRPAPGGFHIDLDGGNRLAAGKVVIAAGLASEPLAARLGMATPVRPVHGQLLITERTAPWLTLPTNVIRQTDEGTYQIGYTTGDLGYSTETRVDYLRDIAANAVRILPRLANLKIVRTWSGLRIMTPDGCPIYTQSTRHPGAFAFTCHSGVTLAACHALECARWIAEGAIPDRWSIFSPERFHVQAA